MTTLTTRYVARNYAAEPSLVFKTPLPAEDPSYPVTNLRDSDRYVVHSYPAQSTDCIYYIDIGTGKTVHAVGFLGLNRGGVGTLPGTYLIERGTTFGSWTAAVPGATVAIGGRDSAVMLASPVADRYWKFTFPIPVLGFTLGKLLVANIVDLGIAYSPGSTEELVRQRSSNRNAMGARLVTETGPARRRFSMHFASIAQGTRDALMAMAALSPVTILHPQFGVAECDLTHDSFEVSHQWGPPDLYNATLDLEQLP